MQTPEESPERVAGGCNSPDVLAPTANDMVARAARARLRQSLFGVQAPPPTIGRFVFLRPLGAGGMGTVSAAYDPSLRREVAIKLVKGQGDPRAQKRLVREAQTTAKVKHPNVIAVYEVGELGDAVFIAMELVDGPNLHLWGQETHERTERLAAVVQAAQGLAAAHEAGLAHCDFKPQNCIIDSSGRVRVVDFGLARAQLDVGTTSSSSDGTWAKTDSRDGGSVTVGSGGTPRYMAPEQARGERVDARSDQFSFAVSAFELLTRRHPFGAEAADYDPRDARVEAVRWQDADLPRHLREALTQALAADPAHRFPSMALLVEALRVDPAASRRVWGMVVAAAGVAVVGGVVGFSSASDDPEPTCDTQQLDTAWNSGRRAAVQSSFASVSAQYATVAWARVEPTLDAYASALQGGLQSLCAVEAVEPQALRTKALRRECLDQRVRELEATVGVFEQADADVVRKWTELVDHLRPITHCEDLSALLVAEVAPPSPEQQEAVSVVSAQFAKIGALRSAGKLVLAEDLATEALEAARATEHGPTVARALINLADSHRFARRAAEAKPLLEEAFAVAMQSDDRESLFLASGAMVHTAAQLQTDDAAQAVWTTVAAAALERAGNPLRLRRQWLTTQGVAAMARGDSAEFLASCEELDALFRKHPEVNDNPLGHQMSLAIALSNAGKHAEAYDRLTRMVKQRADRLGREHPAYGRTLVNAATVALELDRSDEALAHYEEARPVLENALPAGHPDVAVIDIGIGGALGNLGRHAEAVPLMQATLKTLRSTFPEDHPYVAYTLHNLGRSLAGLGRKDEARAAFTQAVSIFEARFGPDNPETLDTIEALAALDD